MTEFLAKQKDNMSKHSNKAMHGLSVGAILWMYHTFATRDSVQEMNRDFRTLEAMHLKASIQTNSPAVYGQE